MKKKPKNLGHVKDLPDLTNDELAAAKDGLNGLADEYHSQVSVIDKELTKRRTEARHLQPYPYTDAEKVRHAGEVTKYK